MTNFLLPTTTFLLLLRLLLTANAVLDTDGNLVLANNQYYILPVVRGQGGGLTLSAKNNTLCPLYVAQEPLEVSRGLPVKFHPKNSKQLPVPLSSDLNIEFDGISTICVTLTGWRLAFDEEAGRWVVGIGGRTGDPGKETLNNWFKIEKGSGSSEEIEFYKIVFCPSVCETCRPVCGDVGVFVEEDGRRWLGLSDKPLLVMFKKVSDDGIISTNSLTSVV